MSLRLFFIAMMVFTSPLHAQVTWPPKPLPAYEKSEVVIWAHYMPQVPMGRIHNSFEHHDDLWPFITQAGNETLRMERNIEAALDSGINGFMCLTVIPNHFLKAAENIYQRTGKMFYMNPQWCDLGEDQIKAANKIKAFILKTKDNPHVFRLDGKQMHFSYGSRHQWAYRINQADPIPTKDRHLDSQGYPTLKKHLGDLANEIIFIPAIGGADRVTLGRGSNNIRYRNWPDDGQFNPDYNWLKQTHWEGITDLNSSTYTADHIRQEVLKAIKQSKPNFIYVPSINYGYDSSNRPFQAIYTASHGFVRLRTQVRQSFLAGFKHLNLSTWNDINETMLMPSTRNVYGYNVMLNYYHHLAQTGKSPYDKTKILIATQPQVLRGEQLEIQALAIPAKDTISTDYLVSVRLEDIHGNEITTLANRLYIENQQTDSLQAMRWDTTHLSSNIRVVIPYVTVKQIARDSQHSKIIYKNKQLQPIEVRYNKLQFYSYQTWDLDRVDNKPLKLRVNGDNSVNMTAGSHTLIDLVADIQGSKKWRRVAVVQANTQLAGFRPDDAITQKQKVYYVTVRLPKATGVKVNLVDGDFDYRYKPHWLEYKMMYTDTKNLQLIKADSGRNQRWVYRIKGSPQTTMTLQAIDSGQKTIGASKTVSIKQLAANDTQYISLSDDKTKTLSVQLTVDGTDANLDLPLNSKGQYVRTIHMSPQQQARRIFYIVGITQDNHIAYSRPIEITRTSLQPRKNVVISDTKEKIIVPLIRTHGVFDDFINDSTANCSNPFEASDIVSIPLAAGDVPYTLLNMDEGAGSKLNDCDMGHNLGRAWISGNAQWISKGWKGSALQLRGGTIKFRSKTFPHGAVTVSMRVQVTPKDKPQILIADGGYWQKAKFGMINLSIHKDGDIVASRHSIHGSHTVKSKTPIGTGWQHIAFVYDLRSLKIYLNGKMAGEKKVSKPAYQRTHSVPSVGFSDIARGAKEDVSPFSGLIDQLEIIGTSLNEKQIQELFQRGQWMGR